MVRIMRFLQKSVDFSAQLMNPDGSTESSITIQAVNFLFVLSW